MMMMMMNNQAIKIYQYVRNIYLNEKETRRKIHRWKEGGNDCATRTPHHRREENTPKPKKGSGINQLE